MTECFVGIPCPNCQEPRRVRTAYIGQYVICRHCKKRFIAEKPAGSERPATPPGYPIDREKTKQTLQKKLQEIEQRRSELDESLLGIPSQFIRLRQEADAEIASLRSQIDQITLECQGARAKSEELTEERDALARKQEETAASHQEIQEQIQLELAQLREEKEAAIRQQQRAKADIAGLQSQVKQLTHRHQEAQSKAEALALQRDELTRKHGEVTAAQKEIASLRSQIDQITLECQGARAKSEELTEERDALARKQEETAASHQETQEQIQLELAQLREEKEAAIRQQQQAKAEIAGLQSQIKQLTHRHQETQSKAEALALQRDELTRKHREATAAQKEIVRRLQGDAAEFKREQEQFIRLRQESDAEIGSLRNHIAEIEQANASSRHERETLIHQHTDFVSQLEALQAERDQTAASPKETAAARDHAERPLRSEIVRVAVDREKARKQNEAVLRELDSALAAVIFGSRNSS